MIIGGALHPPIGEEEMENIFNDDYDLLIIVRNYFVNSGYEGIYIPLPNKNGEMLADGDHVKIEDTKAIDAINNLKNRGYKVIGKDNNTIYFQRWSNLDCGRGIAYSIEGNKIEFFDLKRQIPLPESNWYYYETDFNEWKLQHNQ